MCRDEGGLNQLYHRESFNPLIFTKVNYLRFPKAFHPYKVTKFFDKLFNLLRSNKANDLHIKKAISALSKAREETRKEMTHAQEKLRESLTLEQEARLVVLGWLE